MKTVLEYYYSLKVNDLKFENNNYHFKVENEEFCFVFLNRKETDLEEIVQIINELKNKNIFCHEIIMNNQKSFFTKVEEANYVLLKLNQQNKSLDILNIIDFSNKTALNESAKKNYKNNWAFLWGSKIDYIENQLSEIKINKLILLSINYYIGLAENAIYYVNQTHLKYKIGQFDRVCINHKRVNFPNKDINFLNPLTFIFDLEVRDVASFLKSCFFAGHDALLELETFLKIKKMGQYSYNMLFARLLYPSYYFDIYDEVINQKKDVNNLFKVVKLNKKYEQFLKKAYHEISKYAYLEKISWLIDD